MRTQLLKSGLIYTALGFLNPISRLFIFPVFVNLLQQDDYGVIALTTTFVAFLSVVLPFGFDAAFVRLYYEYKGNDLKRFYHSVVVYVTAIAVVLVAVLELMGPWLFGLLLKTDQVPFALYGRLAYATALGLLFTTLHQSYLRNQLQAERFAVVALAQFVLSTGLELVSVLYFKQGAFGVLLARCIGVCLVSAVVVLPLWWQSLRSFSWQFLQPVYRYGAPMFVYNLMAFVYLQYDRVQVENYLSLKAVAIYSVAFTLAHATELFLVALNSAFMPNVYRLLAEPERDLARVSRLLRAMGYAALGFSVTLLGVVPFFLAAFTPPEYALALPVAALLTAGFLFRYFYIAYTVPIFYQRDQVRRTVWLNVVCGVVVVVANIVLLPRIGLWGAPVSMILARGAQLLAAVLLYRSVSRQANLPIKLRWLPLWYLLVGLYATGLVLAHLLLDLPLFWACGVPLLVAAALLVHQAARAGWRLQALLSRV